MEAPTDITQHAKSISADGDTKAGALCYFWAVFSL